MRIATALLILALTGCITTPAPTATDLTAADYGAQPTRYENVIHAYFDATMKDPSSVQYREISQPTKGYIAHGGAALVSKYVKYGWQVTATINAKKVLRRIRRVQDVHVPLSRRINSRSDQSGGMI